MSTIRPGLPPTTTPASSPPGEPASARKTKSANPQTLPEWESRDPKQSKLTGKSSASGAISIPDDAVQANERQAAVKKPVPQTPPKPVPQTATKPLPPMTHAEKVNTTALANQSAAAMIKYINDPRPANGAAVSNADYKLRAANAAYLRRVGQKPTMRAEDKQMQGLFFEETIAAVTRQITAYQASLKTTPKNSPAYKATSKLLAGANTVRTIYLAQRKEAIGK